MTSEVAPSNHNTPKILLCEPASFHSTHTFKGSAQPHRGRRQHTRTQETRAMSGKYNSCAQATKVTRRNYLSSTHLRARVAGHTGHCHSVTEYTQKYTSQLNYGTSRAQQRRVGQEVEYVCVVSEARTKWREKNANKTGVRECTSIPDWNVRVYRSGALSRANWH